MKLTNHIANTYIRNLIAAITLFMALFLLPTNVHAQIRCTFEAIQMDRGLSSNKVNFVYHDSRGYIWIATENGLNRFDGYRMRQYFTRFDPKNIKSNSFRSLYEDGNRVIWVGVKHDDYTLYHMDEDRFDCDVERYLKKLGLKNIPTQYKIKIDANRNLWVRGDKGLEHYDFKKAKWKHYDVFGIEAIYIRDSKAYIVQNDLTIKIISFNTGRIETDNSFKQEVSDFCCVRPRIFVDSHHGIWIFNRMHDRLLHKESGAKKWHEFKPGIDCTNLDVRSIAETSDGVILIANGHLSLCYYDKDTRTILEPDNKQSGLPSGIVNYVNQYEKSIWVGFEREGAAVALTPLSGFESPYIKSNNAAPLNNMNCTSFAVDDNNKVWIGTDGEGIYIVDHYANLVRHFDLEDKLNVVVSLFKDSKGRMWVCTFKDGIYIFDSPTATPIHIKEGECGLADNSVWCAREDFQGNMWIGCLINGVQKWDEKKRCFLPTGIKNITVTDMALAPDSIFIIATPNGHLDFDYKTGKVWNCGFNDDVYKKYGINDKGTNRIFFDSRQWLWEGGKNGLIIRNKHNNTYLRLTCDNGLANEVIHGIVEDKEHNMWISTEFGISRVIIEKGTKVPSLENMTIQNFNNYNGLQCNLFNDGAILASGQFVLAGSTNGVCTIRPKLVPKKQEKYEVTITELDLGHDSVCASVDTNVVYRYEYNESHIHVKYSTLNSSAITNMSYAYRLNSNKEWTFTHSTELIFSHLSPGNYVLEICLLSDTKDVCDKITRLKFYVCYPWWLTWWAITLYILIAIAAGIIFYQTKKKITVLKDNIAEMQRGILLAMEKRQNERIRESIMPSEVEVADEDMDFKNRVVKAIESHIDDCDFTVEQLSRELGMSRANLHRKLVAISGQGPLGVIRLVRMKRAKQLLEKSQLTIAEISYSVGINNPKNFSKYFKEEFGVTPTQYRESNECVK